MHVVCGKCFVIRRYTRQRSFFWQTVWLSELNLNQSRVQWFVWNKLWLFEWSGSLSDGYGMCRCCCMMLIIRYLDRRNDDLRWILSSSAYTRFLTINIFRRPIYAMNNVCYLRVYKVYLTEVSSISGRPVHYLTYHGAHSRRFTGIQAITVRIIPVVIIIRCIKVISTLVRVQKTWLYRSSAG